MDTGPMIDRLAAREWLANHLVALVWCALVLWVPPVVFAIGVDLSLLQPAGSGYPALTDPSLILAAFQLTLMLASLFGMTERRRRSWWLLFGAVLVWCAHASWGILVRVRLSGGAVLFSWETILAVMGPAFAAVIMLIVRTPFTTGLPLLMRDSTRVRPPVGPLPGMK